MLKNSSLKQTKHIYSQTELVWFNSFIDNSSFLVNVSFIKFDFNLSTKQLTAKHGINQSKDGGGGDNDEGNNDENCDENEW